MLKSKKSDVYLVSKKPVEVETSFDNTAFSPTEKQTEQDGDATGVKYKYVYVLIQASQSNEQKCQKTYLLTCAPSEDSDQPAHSRRLIGIFTVSIVDSQGCKCFFFFFFFFFFLMRTTKTLIRLRDSAGCFENLLGIHNRRYVFSCCGQNTRVSQ